MAIRDTCPRCGRTICAPDSERGKRVPCPECGRKTVLRSEEERRRERNERARRESARRRDLARIAFLERLEEARGSDAPGARGGLGALPPMTPIVPRRRRLRILVDFTLLAAYAVGALSAAGLGLTIYLGTEGVIGRPLIVVLASIGWAIIGLAGFASLKFAGELGLLVGELAEEIGERARRSDRTGPSPVDGRRVRSGVAPPDG